MERSEANGKSWKGRLLWMLAGLAAIVIAYLVGKKVLNGEAWRKFLAKREAAAMGRDEES